MNRESYQTAFSWLEPSPSAVAQAMEAANTKKKARPSVRLGTVLAAAALAVALLSGGVFAAAELHWFSLGSGERIVDPVNTDPERIGSEWELPSAQGVLDFEAPKGDTRIGFRLPDSYQTDKASLECRMLPGGLYQRYYRAADLLDPDCPLLCIEILDNERTDYRTYYTRCQTEFVKQEKLNGMDTVWLKISHPEYNRTEYCLFRVNEDLGCIAAISSTVSFAEAEQAAADLTFVDSGIPVTPEEAVVYYGMRLGWIPEDMTVDHHHSLADDWSVVNATLLNPEQALSEAWTGASIIRFDETEHVHMSVTITQDLDRFYDSARVEYGEIYKTGTLGGYEARWVHSRSGDTAVEIYVPEYRVMLSIWINCTDMDPESNYAILPAEDSLVEKAEQILTAIEIVSVPVSEEAPVEYMPFAVG